MQVRTHTTGSGCVSTAPASGVPLIRQPLLTMAGHREQAAMRKCLNFVYLDVARMLRP